MGKFAAVFLIAFAACLLGCAVFVVGLLMGKPQLADAGEWMTLPLTAIFAVLIAAAVVGVALAPFVKAASWLQSAWRSRRPR